jgi:hypothetical protein
MANNEIYNMTEPEYEKSVLQRIEEYSLPPFKIKTNEDGTKEKIFPDGYKQENNVERLKFIYFAKAANFEPDICESFLNPDAPSIRMEIQQLNLADLMIRATNGSYK